MKITDIYVGASKSTGGSSVGYGTVTFDDVLKVRFNIMKTKADSRLFVNWPSQKGSDGTYYPQVSFVQDEASENQYAEKNAIEEPIIKEFNKLLGTNSMEEKPKEETPAPPPVERKKAAGIKFAAKG